MKGAIRKMRCIKTSFIVEGVPAQVFESCRFVFEKNITLFEVSS